MTGLNQPAVGFNYSAAYDVLQFPYISGPTMGLQFLPCFIRKALNSLMKLPVESFEQFSSQWQHIFGAVAKRRDFKRVFVHTLPQVKAKAPFIDGFLYVLIGGGNDTYINVSSMNYKCL